MIQNPQDFIGGVALLLASIFAFWATSDLEGMRESQFGAGAAPRLFAGCLAFVGIAIAGGAIFAKGSPVPRYALRGPLVVTASILIFAVTVIPLGLIIASFLMFVFSASGSRELRLGESLLAGIAISIFCAVLFVYILGNQFPLWPNFTIGNMAVNF